MPKFVAILEDDSARLAEMRACLAEMLPNYQHIYFDDAFVMIGWLENHLPEIVLISLDNDLPTDVDHGTGRDVADFLATNVAICPIIVHTSNEYFAPGIMQALRGADWPCERVYPHSDHNWVQSGWANQIEKFIKNGLIFE